MEEKMEENTKDILEKAEIEKQVSEMKFKGNRKQFEFNAKLEGILDKIKHESGSKNKQIAKLVKEGKELIRKRQKLIRLADKSKDGWKVVDEYLSDELALDSEDEKKLRKAKIAAARKRPNRSGNFSRQKEDGGARGPGRQFFRGLIYYLI